MTAIGWAQALFLLVAVVLSTPPLGRLLLAALERGSSRARRPLRWLEGLVLRGAGVDVAEQSWRAYSRSLLVFSAAGVAITFAIQRLQHLLPLNPARVGPVGAALAFNTAASFVSNTNWQAYAGETTMSYLTQMAGLTWQNFVSAAAGLAVAMALARGLTRAGDGRGDGTVGNFWVDLTRATVHVLLPLSIAAALFFASRGVIQNFDPPRVVTTIEGATRTLAMGPVASQEAIKQVGTNGGGFFNANAAHPFENPDPLANFVSMFLILALPAAATFTFGRMAGDARQGWALLAAMGILFVAGLAVAYWAEASPPGPSLDGVDARAGNLEGKEVRFGAAASALYATVTTDASCGAVNAMHDSFTPLGGLVTLFNIQMGEVVFGGVGAGLYGVLVMAIVAVFIAGLMVGRTPEYLGKKIEARQMRLATLYILIPPILILVFAAWSLVAPYGRGALGNAGPHGLSEVLYAFTSAAGNNGSAFAGLAADTPWYDVTLGLVMLAGRFLMMLPVLALAGSLAGKRVVPPGPGTLPTGGALFVFLLVGVIVIAGALTFFPALALGPIVEHFLMRAGQVH
ncbi:MAG TPA: potassium-transporting ATPase subunit KdpA [Dongiaceae bacterium]|nr:potassium-transporting ATPase subunit KdpA [Dongiaceae bacterium]